MNAGDGKQCNLTADASGIILDGGTVTMLTYTGRWARIPREERLCSCGTGEVQTEEHVLVLCPLSNQLHSLYPDINFRLPDMFASPSMSLAAYIYNCLNIF